jgi:hypothetical protein
MRPRFWVAAALVVVVPFTPRLAKALRPAPPDPRVLPASAVDPHETYSNILPGDYVGPETCAGCHRAKFQRWSSHPHSRMNQLPTKYSVRGDFADHVLKLRQGAVTFSTDDDGYRMSVSRDGRPLRRYRVTRTVGTRFAQFYIGVQEEGPEPAGHGVYGEHMLPFAYWISIGRWLPKHYFDLDGSEELRDGVPVVEAVDRIRDVRPYNDVCMNCHNTYPYSYRIFHKIYAGFPAATVAAALEPLSQALAPTVEVGASVESFTKLNSRLDPDRHLVTLGISCESCHFGGREHAQEGGKIRWVPTSPFLRLTAHDPERPVTGQRGNAATIAGICTQCHSGNATHYPNGAAQFNSREGFDLHAGACSSQLHCAHCHEPHTMGPPSGGPTQPKHLAQCVRCHPQHRDESKAAAHSRHAAASGVDCLDCHMPRQTLGVDALIRTHRVCLPVEESMVAKGSANACNLCHLDRSMNWTLRELERGWGRRIAPAPTWASAGSLDRPAGELWLGSDVPVLRFVAAQSYARSPLGKGKLPDLLRALNDPEPINRVFAARAVERVCGRKLGRSEYEVTAPPADRRRQIEALLGELTRGPGRGR